MGDTQYQPIMVNNIISGGTILCKSSLYLTVDCFMTHYHSIHLPCPQAVSGDIGIVVTLEVCKSVEAVWTSAGKGVLGW